MTTILQVAGILIAIIIVVAVGFALAVALIVFSHQRRWAKLKSDKYDQFNQDEEETRTIADKGSL